MSQTSLRNRFAENREQPSLESILREEIRPMDDLRTTSIFPEGGAVFIIFGCPCYKYFQVI